MLSLFVFLLGLVIGSFLTACIYRLPLNQSLVKPRSHCNICNQQLQLRDLIPVISFLLLRGRCRFCRELISSRYICVELLTGFLYIWCFAIFGISLLTIKSIILSTFLIGITFIDIDHQLILDKVLIGLAITGVITNLSITSVAAGDMAIAALTGGGIFLFIAIVTKGGMGGGDIKFVAALGLWLGLKLTLLTILLSFLVGGLGSGLLLLTRLKRRKDFIPFGPFIAASAFISMLYGEQLISWYVAVFLK